MREYLDSTDGAVQMAPLPGYAPDLNPVEYLWTRFKPHALTNFCLNNLVELKYAARCKLKSRQKRKSIIASWSKVNLTSFLPRSSLV